MRWVGEWWGPLFRTCPKINIFINCFYTAQDFFHVGGPKKLFWAASLQLLKVAMAVAVSKHGQAGLL